jgi:hypothetical protein
MAFSMKPQPTKISTLLQNSGFVIDKEDPRLFFSLKPMTITVNNIRFSFVKNIYLGEEAMTINGYATVFYSDIKNFHIGGIQRLIL